MFEITMAGAAKNSLGTEMMDWLFAKLEEAKGRPFLLTGTGDAFSAGLNLKEVASLDAGGMETFLLKLEKLMTALFSHPAPTVALVNGHAIAGGCLLTLCCDHRIAANNPRTKIGLNEVALGLRFPPRVMAIVKHRVAQRALERVVLGAELFDPKGALEAGIVDEVADDARAAAEKRLAHLSSHPAEAYAIAKRELRASVTAIPDEVEEKFLREALGAWTSPDLKAKIQMLLGR